MRIWIIELKQKIDTKWTETFQLFVLLSLWLKNGEQSIQSIQAESDDQNFVQQVDNFWDNFKLVFWVNQPNKNTLSE